MVNKIIDDFVNDLKAGATKCRHKEKAEYLECLPSKRQIARAQNALMEMLMLHQECDEEAAKVVQGLSPLTDAWERHFAGQSEISDAALEAIKPQMIFFKK